MAARGALRRRRGQPSGRPSTSAAGASTGRSTGSTGRPTAAPSSIDYKLAGSVTPRDKFEERAKLQLPLYLLAAQSHWGAEPVGGIYHPLRGTSNRRPRGVVAKSSAGDLADYDLYGRDLVDDEALEELLETTRRRAGEIVARIRAGDIRRDPGPREGLRGHDVCPACCAFAPICRRDRAPSYVDEEEAEERERAMTRRRRARGERTPTPEQARRSRPAAATSCSRRAPAPARPG